VFCRAGATMLSFLGYAVERNIAPKEKKKKKKHEARTNLGQRVHQRSCCTETANNAACTGSFLPLLFTLGIPGLASTAILLGALIALKRHTGAHGLMNRRAEIFWLSIMSWFHR